MALLASVQQQPKDIRDYDIDFSEWFPVGDVVTEAEISVFPEGLTVSYALQAPRIKVWVSNGVDKGVYKITVLAKTNDGRAKEVEMRVKIKDI